MQESAEKHMTIAAARADFLRFGHAETWGVPGVVAASWQRSFSAGVDASTAQAVFQSDLDLTGRLMRCSKPVIARLGDEMAEMPLSIVLTDYRARILSRSETDKTIGTLLDEVSLAPGFNYAEESVGTNGIGTVLESGQPLYIVGPEHFHEHLQPFACAGSPIRDPLTGRVEGVLDISCLSEHSSPLMRSLVRSAAHEIERNLLVDRSQRQQALFEAYVRVDARTHGAVLAIGGTMVMGNALAQNLFNPAEQWTIHEHARYLMIGQGNPVDHLELSSGKVVHIRGTRVVVGTDVAGIVVIVDIVSEAAPVPVRSPDLDGGLSTMRPAPVEPDRSSVFGTDRSPLGKRAYTDISDALAAGLALLVLGEPGCGKLSLLADAYHRVVPNGRSLVFASMGLDLRSVSEEVERLSEKTGPMLFIFSNVDRLNADGVAGLKALLLAAGNLPVSFAATVSDTDLDYGLPFAGLLEHFEASVTVAPLRHRREDLPLLVAGVLESVTGRRGSTVSAAAMRVLSRYAWPRNVRQLAEALESALLKRPAGEIQAEDLPGYCHSGARRLLSPLEAGERDLIVSALHEADGNRVRTAEALGIARSSLYRKLKSFGITAA